jgi:DoxX-like family
VAIALIIVATLLGIAAAGSAVQKLRRDATVVASMPSVGVGDGQIPVLAVLELLGAAGLLVGIWFVPLGILAAIGLTLYFLGAVIAHIRAKAPVKEAAPALVLALLALATALLEFAR